MPNKADETNKKKRSLKLRDKLFLSFSLLSVAILLLSAYVIHVEVVSQARRQVQEEMKNSLPLYDAVWEEQAVRLSSLAMGMAGSTIVKAIFGDPRASHDRETIRQMLSEFGEPLTENVDFILITDGGGRVLFAESHGRSMPRPKDLPSTGIVANTQKPAQSFELVNGRLLHLAYAPVISHSADPRVDSTLAVLVAGFELNRAMARELRKQAHSDVIFFVGDRIHSSSLDPELQEAAARKISAREIARQPVEEPFELRLGRDDQLAFARMLMSLDGQVVGYTVVLHSLAEANLLFRAISTRLVLVGAVGVALVLFMSYLIARKVTQPIESLVEGAREFGQGNYGHPIDLSADGEVGHLAAAFDQMRRSIIHGQAMSLRSERLATIGRMASGIIHDLRGPLATVSSAAELLAGAELSQDQRRMLAQSQQRASQRMGALLTELLDMSRGRLSLQQGMYELAPLIESVTQECVTAEIAPGVIVDANIPSGLLVHIDYERTRRLVANLLSNSIQAMPGGGTISIQAHEDNGRVRLNIADTGCGIPESVRASMFDPFVSHGKQGGTGLGLAIAKSIAEAQGGSLTLVSAGGEPANFCLELPLATESEHA